MSKPIEIKLSLDISPVFEFFRGRKKLLENCVQRGVASESVLQQFVRLENDPLPALANEIRIVLYPSDDNRTGL